MDQIKFLQANVNKSSQITKRTVEIAWQQNIDVLLLQEINLKDNKLNGCPRKFNYEIARTPAKTAIIILNKKLHYSRLDTRSKYLSGCKLHSSNGWVNIYSVYLPPKIKNEWQEALNELEDVIRCTTTPSIIGGDLNARSKRWYDNQENRKGKILSAFIDRNELEVINVGSQPTYEQERSTHTRYSIVDLTLCTTNLITKVGSWKVRNDTFTGSDHHPIEFNIGGRAEIDFIDSTKIYTSNPKDWSQFETRLQQNLKQTNSNGTVDHKVNAYMSAITDAAKRTLRKKQQEDRREKPIWWTQEIDNLERRVMAVRRTIKWRAQHRRDELIEKLGELREELRKQVNIARSTTWKAFTENLTSKDTWNPVNKLIKYSRPNKPDCIRDDSGVELSREKSAQQLLYAHFPDDDSSTETNVHREIRTEIATPYHEQEDPLFTMHEMNDIFTQIAREKTPGADGLNSVICQKTKEAAPERLLETYNACLEQGVFPKEWKTAVIKFIPKPGKKSYKDAKSYRPIGLLSIMSKGLEKLIQRRVAWHLETRNILSDQQYGFREGRSSEVALHHIIEKIKDYKAHNQFLTIIALDIEGAFDNAWWPIVLQQLRKARIPSNIYRLLTSYLSDRIVEARFLGERTTKPCNKGCIQGSVLGPLIWNLIINPLLNDLNGTGVYVTAFADDITIIIPANTKDELSKSIEATMRTCDMWAHQNKMKFSATKSVQMWITKPLNELNAKIDNKQLPSVNHVKILGMEIDRKLTMRVQFNTCLHKTWTYTRNAIRVAKQLFGSHNDIFRTIFNGVVIPMITYGIAEWGKILETKTCQEKLKRLQRDYIISTQKLYPTTSWVSCWSLCGYVPITLHCMEILLRKQAIQMGIQFDILPNDREMEKNVFHSTSLPPYDPIDEHVHTNFDPLVQKEIFETHNTINIFTDGSKNERKTGAGICAYKSGRIIWTKKLLLPAYCTIFQAELQGILCALREIKRRQTTGQVHIWSDSLSSLLAIKRRNCKDEQAMETRILLRELNTNSLSVKLHYVKAHIGVEGNERADELAKLACNKKTQPDFDLVPKSYIKMKLREEMYKEMDTTYTEKANKTLLSWYGNWKEALRVSQINHIRNITPFITSHGFFRSHLKRTNPDLDERCNFCKQGLEQTSDHILLDCDYFSKDRKRIMDRLAFLNKDNSNHGKDVKKLISEHITEEEIQKVIKKIYTSCVNTNLKHGLHSALKL